MDRYAVLQRLSEPQNVALGLAAGSIEAVSTQPLTYFKNTLQQKIKISFNPRIMYRGTTASMVNDSTLIGSQFLVCGWLQKQMMAERDRRTQPLTFREEVTCGWLAGFASGVPCSMLELTMIQQQRFGGTAFDAIRRMVHYNGLLGCFRGFVPTSQREAFFAVGYLGVLPRIERICTESLDLGTVNSNVIASITSGVVCAALTHPFDTCKSIMQGNLTGPGFAATLKDVYAEGGMKAFYRGYAARAAMICCCFFIFNETKLRLGYALWPGQLRE